MGAASSTRGTRRTDDAGEDRCPLFPLRGGHVALDFANTAGWHASAAPSEWLTDYPALLAWGRQAGVLTDDEAQHLRDQGARHPGAAAAVLDRAKALREMLYRLFTALTRRRSPDAADLIALNAALDQTFDRLQVSAGNGAYRWEWASARNDLDRMLWPVVRAAADLLIGDQRQLVRQCAGDPCGWLFLDTSRKHNRRWCSMADCGNRAKARRHRARRQVPPRRAASAGLRPA